MSAWLCPCNCSCHTCLPLLFHRLPRPTVAEYRRQANLEANNGRERKDLYTDNWDGAEYKGSPWNILNLLLALSILAPIAGLIFAFQTYGILWG